MRRLPHHTPLFLSTLDICKCYDNIGPPPPPPRVRSLLKPLLRPRHGPASKLSRSLTLHRPRRVLRGCSHILCVGGARALHGSINQTVIGQPLARWVCIFKQTRCVRSAQMRCVKTLGIVSSAATIRKKSSGGEKLQRNFCNGWDKHKPNCRSQHCNYEALFRACGVRDMSNRTCTTMAMVKLKGRSLRLASS